VRIVATENWKVQQSLPLARIKKIMRVELICNEELSKETNDASSQYTSGRFMIATEAPFLMCKACELMIQELTTRAWYHTEKCNRKTVKKEEFHAAIADDEVYDFLIDSIPPQKSTPQKISMPLLTYPSPYYPYGAIMASLHMPASPAFQESTATSAEIAVEQAAMNDRNIEASRLPD